MQTYDIIVIGGGAAGMFAAGFAAREGGKVLLLEKNRRCGAKLLITGKGRCNVTSSEHNPRRFVEAFGRNGKAFLTALYAFGVDETIDFFEQRGLSLKIERGGRVFPERGSAADVLKVLDGFIAESGVKLLTGCEVTGLSLAGGGRVESVVTAQGEFRAETFILATGGLSYRETGCTGDGYRWATQTGHAVIKPEPALVSVKLAEDWTGEVCDFNLKNVKVTVLLDGRKIDERFGEAFFTRAGIGGPIILDMSSGIRDALKSGRVSLRLDLKPALDMQTFDRRLQRELEANSNRDFRNALDGLLPRAMISLFIRLSGIDPAKKCHSVTRQERSRLLDLFKQLPLTVTGCGDFRRAIITSGGVSLDEIDMRSMRSKKVDNLFFAGEVIDLDGPTGGFNLQVCWSTGYLAGRSAVRESRPGL
jgi:predicted Rossmann fold flavoprotein